MKLSVSHEFDVPANQVEAWYLIEHWAQAFGYRFTAKGERAATAQRGRSSFWSSGVDLRKAKTTVEIQLQGGRGIAVLNADWDYPDDMEFPEGVTPDWSFAEAYLTTELSALGNDLGPLEILRVKAAGDAARAKADALGHKAKNDADDDDEDNDGDGEDADDVALSALLERIYERKGAKGVFLFEFSKGMGEGVAGGVVLAVMAGVAFLIWV